MPKVSVLPFSESPANTAAALLTYLASKPYLPSEFVSAPLTSKALFAPVHNFLLTWNVQWSAEFGNNRTEHYTTYGRDERGHQKAHNHTRIVTDWRSWGGTDQGSASILIYAGTRLPPQAVALVEASNPRRAHQVEADAMDMDVEPFSFTEGELWSRAGVQRAGTIIDNSIRQWRQGDKQRNWHWSGSNAYTVSQLLCPVEGFALSYAGRDYLFWMDGSNASRIRHDPLPRDYRRIIRHALFFFPAGVVLYGTIWNIWHFGLDITVLYEASALLIAIIGACLYMKRRRRTVRERRVASYLRIGGPKGNRLS